MTDDRKLDLLFTQLATWLRSGASAVVMLPSLLDASPVSLRAPLQRALTGSSTLSQAFGASGLLSSSERALLEAGESSGRLPELLDALAHLRSQRRATRRLLLAGLAYPASLLVLGGFLLTAPMAITRGVGAWLSVAVWPFILVSALAVMFFVLAPRLPRDAWLVTAPRRFASRVPLLGKGFAGGSAAVFCDVLAHLIGAGLPYTLALPAALQASGVDSNSRKERELMRALDAGATLTEALRSSQIVPVHMLPTLNSAEQSGTLERALTVLARDEGQRYRSFLRALVALTSVAVFGLVVVAIAATIIMGASSYIERIDAIGTTSMRQ